MSTPEVVALRPNWRDAISERWEYRTEVQQAYDGREIRRSLRNRPRREVEYEFLFPTAEECERAMRMMFRRLWVDVRIPLWMDAQPADVDSGDTTLSVSTVGYDYVNGAEAIIWESPSKWHVCEDLTVAPSSLTWTNATTQSLKGRIMPLRKAFLIDVIAGQIYAVNAHSARMRWLINETEPLGRLNAATYPAYHGRPVYALPSGEDSRRISIERKMGEADFGVGARRRYESWAAAAITKDFEWVIGRRSDIAETLEWIHRHRGKWGWFWWDARGYDLRVTANIGASATTWNIAPVDGFPLTFYGTTPPQSRRDVVLRLKDGTVYRRRITSWTATSITVDSATGTAVNVSDIDRLSWLQPTRFDNDAFELRWETTTLLRFSARHRSILTV